MPDTTREEMEKKVAEELCMCTLSDGTPLLKIEQENLFDALVSAHLEIEEWVRKANEMEQTFKMQIAEIEKKDAELAKLKSMIYGHTEME